MWRCRRYQRCVYYSIEHQPVLLVGIYLLSTDIRHYRSYTTSLIAPVVLRGFRPLLPSFRHRSGCEPFDVMLSIGASLLLFAELLKVVILCRRSVSIHFRWLNWLQLQEDPSRSKCRHTIPRCSAQGRVSGGVPWLLSRTSCREGQG